MTDEQIEKTPMRLRHRRWETKDCLHANKLGAMKSQHYEWYRRAVGLALINKY